MLKTENRTQPYLILGVVTSLLIHIFFFISLNRPSSIKRPNLTPDTVTTIEIIPAPAPSAPAAKQESLQIVSPSEQKLVLPVPATNFRSEHDSSVAKQQLKRGDDPDAAPVVSKTSPTKSPPAPTASKQQAAQPNKAEAAQPQQNRKIQTLKLDTQTLIDRFGEISAPDKSADKQDLSRDPSHLQAFSRPAGSGARFVGQSGSSDYLPDLPDGDLTLLNAKADRFAVFVRRVALQVFSALRESGWEKLSRRDIELLNNFNSFSAVMSSDGRLISVKLQNSAGNSRFDEIVNLAVKQGAHDPHPPVGAQASDGNIRFIFKARSWASTGVGAKSGAPFERRWLVLATGLE